MSPLASLGRALQWAGNALTSRTGAEGLGGSGLGANYSGTPISPARAMSLTSCYAAINVISRDLASLPLDSYRTLPDGSMRPALEDHKRRELLRFTPDGERTAFGYRQSKIAHAVTYGNGYSEIERSKFDGSPIAFHLLDPRETRACRTRRTKSLYYEQDRGKALRAEDVIHFAPLGFDGITGYSPIRLAQQAFGLGLSLENSAAALFGNGVRPGGVIKTPKKLNPEGVTRLREGMERVHQGSENAFRTMVLEEGADWTQVTIPPNEAQFIESRGFQVLEIARMYGLPPHKLGDWTQSHDASVEEGNLDYITTLLMPWCVSMEGQLDLKLYNKSDRAAGLRAIHDMTALLRGNMGARGAFYDVMLKWGIISPNYVAAKEGYPLIGSAGDVHLMQLNMTTLESVAKPKPQTVSASGVIKDAEPAEAATTDVQATALNGAQVTSLLQIVVGVGDGTVAPDSAKGMLGAAFPNFNPDQINAMVDSAASFHPKPQESVPAGSV